MYDLTHYLPAIALQSAWVMQNEIKVTIDPTAKQPIHIEATGDTTQALMNSMAYTSSQKSMCLLQSKSLGLYMRQGPVIIRPSAELCSAMIDTEVNVSVRDYHQPYPVIGVELPKFLAGPHYPCLTLCWKINDDAIFMWTYSKVTGLTYHLAASNDMPTLEDRLAIGEAVDTEDEYNLMILGARATLNLGLLASCRSTETTPLPPAAERHRRQRDPRLRELGARHVQEIRFLDIVLKARPPASPVEWQRTGRKLGPHSRRGHWKMVPYGPKHSMRKRMWINSYWVGPQDELPPTTVLT